MESKIVQAISLKYNPVAIFWTDNKPENALQFKKGGFGNQYLNFPGGINCFYGFLSNGNEHTENGRSVAKKMENFARQKLIDDFRHGEGFIKSPELVSSCDIIRNRNPDQIFNYKLYNLAAGRCDHTRIILATWKNNDILPET